MHGNDRSLDVTVLGLDGFRLLAATEDEGGLLAPPDCFGPAIWLTSTLYSS